MEADSDVFLRRVLAKDELEVVRLMRDSEALHTRDDENIPDHQTPEWLITTPIGRIDVPAPPGIKFKNGHVRVDIGKFILMNLSGSHPFKFI